VVGLVYSLAVGSVLMKMGASGKATEAQRLMRSSTRNRGSSGTTEQGEDESSVERQLSMMRQRFFAVLIIIAIVVPVDAYTFFTRRNSPQTDFVEPLAFHDQIFLTDFVLRTLQIVALWCTFWYAYVPREVALALEPPVATRSQSASRA